jgi:general secretion pathway protein D
VQPADLAVSVGKEFKIDVMAKRARGITGEALALAFDPRVVEFREATEGELLGGMRNKASITSHSTEGAVELRFHKPSTIPMSEGRLVSLTFAAKAPGVSPVRVTIGGETQEPSDLSRAGKGVVRVR